MWISGRCWKLYMLAHIGLIPTANRHWRQSIRFPKYGPRNPLIKTSTSLSPYCVGSAGRLFLTRSVSTSYVSLFRLRSSDEHHHDRRHSNLSPSITEQPSKKRKLDYDAPEYKVMNVAPSQFAKPSNFRKAMEQDEGRECYIHNRPITFDEVPLTLISPIFGRFSDDLFTLEKDFRSEDFAPARDLANMLSKLAKDEASRNGAFLDWLLKTLPSIERTKSSGDASLKPHEVRPRLLTAIIKGEHEDSRHDYATDGHVELGDNLLLVTESELELGEGSSNPHWQLMAYTRAYYMQKRCSYRVGRSCLPAVLIAHYGTLISCNIARLLKLEAFQGPVSTLLRLSFVPTDRCKLKH